MISVGRARRRKTSTVNTASSAPKASEKSVSFTASRTVCEKSMKPASRRSIVMPLGRIARISSSRCLTSSTIATVLPPDCFWMPRPIDGLAVVVRLDAHVLRAVLDARHVAELHGRAVDVGHDQLLELRDRLELGLGLHGVLAQPALDDSTGNLEVLALQRAQRVARGEPARAQRLAVEPDAKVRGRAGRTP